MKTRLKLYLLENIHENGAWEYYASCIVAASSPKKALTVKPVKDAGEKVWPVDPEFITIKLIGTARYGAAQGVVHVSFIGS